MCSILNDKHTEINTFRAVSVDELVRYVEGPTGLSLFHTNIRSINKNFNELQVFLEKIDVAFDVIALTETWNISNHNYFSLLGYYPYYNNGNINQNDGVVVYVKENVNHSSQVVEIGKVRCIRLCVRNSKELGEVYISVIYRPPSINEMEFTNNFYEYLHGYCNKTNEIIMGDLNINTLAINQVSSDYLNCLYQHGFLPCITSHTRSQNNTQSCIDHIFAKTKLDPSLIIPIVYESTITDHFSTILLIKSNNKHETVGKKSQFSITNFKKIKEAFAEGNWTPNHDDEKNVNVLTETLLSKLKHQIECNTITIWGKSKKKKRKPWITNSLIFAMKERDRLYQQCKRSKQQHDIEAFKAHRNKINSLVNKVKAQYYRNKIHEHPKDINLIWSTVKDSLNMNKTRVKNVSGISIEDYYITDSKDIANEFNKYYIRVAKELADKITDVNGENEFSLKTHCGTSLFLLPTTRSEIIKLIKELKPNTSPGPDGITVKIMQILAEDIATPIMNIINIAFLTGTYPQQFKQSIVIPIHKSGNIDNVENYRPISLISNIGKIFEKCIKKRIVAFLEKYNLLSDRQYGFRSGKSTQDAIVYVTREIYNALGSSTPCLGVFIDLAKAFDTVSHVKLFEKLECIGIRGNALTLIKSYLQNRTQRTKINDELSDPLDIKYGIPQGTVLGPVLFTIYINDLLTNKYIKGNLVSYADDTVAIYKEESWDLLERTVVKDLLNIKKWMNANLLTMNFKKTSFIPFASYKTHLPSFNQLIVHTNICTQKITCNCTLKINRAKNIKYLGVILDTNMRWDYHIMFLVKRLRGFIYIFKQIRHFLSTNALKVVYRALVESHLTYGILGWGGVNKTTLKHLNTVQKLILKISFFKNITYNTDQLYEDTKLMDTRQLYTKTLLKHIFKNKHIVTRHEVPHSHSTRKKDNQIYNLPFCRKLHATRNVETLGVKIYNLLPIQIKTEKSLHSFARLIMGWIWDSRLTLNNILS